MSDNGQQAQGASVGARRAPMGPAVQRAARIAFWAALAGFFLTFGFNSLTRRDNFNDPDTMNFVDVARNVATGRGLTQSTLGFNQPRFAVGDAIPAPFTSQPPVYPLLVALPAWAGLPVVDSALAVSWLAFGLVLLLAYRLGLELYDARVGLLSVVLLLSYDPLYRLANTAFSELTGLLFVFLSLWLLAKGMRAGSGAKAGAGAGSRAGNVAGSSAGLLRGRPYERWRGNGRSGLLAAAGVCAGLAFAPRYALLPLAGVGLAVILLESNARRRDLIGFGLGFLLPALLVWGHNWAASGALMPRPNPSTSGLATNLTQTFQALIGGYWTRERLSMNAQIILALAGMALTAAWLAARRRLGQTARELFVPRGRVMLALWGLAYLGFLVYQRTLTQFDDIDTRLVLPAGAVLLVLLAALLIQAFPVKPAWVLYGGAALALLALARETQFTARTAPVDRSAPVAQSALLSWLKTETTARDLVVGLNAVYVPFYFGPRAALSFSPFPYTNYLDYPHLLAYARQHCAAYAHVYLALPDAARFSPAEWNADFGPFIADAASGRWQSYPDLDVLQQFSDGTIFGVECG